MKEKEKSYSKSFKVFPVFSSWHLGLRGWKGTSSEAPGIK